MTRLETALGEIVAAREYTRQMLAAIDQRDWFRLPQEGVTHIAWQVGHLAMAQYRLALVRVRGPKPEDAEFMPPEYMPLFGKDSQPAAERSKYPQPAAIMAVFDAVHSRVLADLPLVPDAQLDEPCPPPHPQFRDKLGSIFWCARHEMLHTGQIGLLRRLLGAKPMW
jgi:hypothetical protein